MRSLSKRNTQEYTLPCPNSYRRMISAIITVEYHNKIFVTSSSTIHTIMFINVWQMHYSANNLCCFGIINWKSFVSWCYYKTTLKIRLGLGFSIGKTMLFLFCYILIIVAKYTACCKSPPFQFLKSSLSNILLMSNK